MIGLWSFWCHFLQASLPRVALSAAVEYERITVVRPTVLEWVQCGTAYYGGMRRAPSNRMTEPFSMGLVNIVPTSSANSAGFPKREGKGTDAPSSSCTAGGNFSSSGVRNSPGACNRQKIIVRKRVSNSHIKLPTHHTHNSHDPNAMGC